MKPSTITDITESTSRLNNRFLQHILENQNKIQKITITLNNYWKLTLITVQHNTYLFVKTITKVFQNCKVKRCFTLFMFWTYFFATVNSSTIATKWVLFLWTYSSILGWTEQHSHAHSTSGRSCQADQLLQYSRWPVCIVDFCYY